MLDLVVDLIVIIISIPYWGSVLTGFTRLRYGKSENRKLPKISVIIPTRNEENVIEKTLKKVRSSDYPKNKMEIIVVDANSADRTISIARKYADKIIIEKKPHGKPHALNIAVKKCTGEFVYILDADSWVEKSTIKNLISHMDGCKAVMGLSLPENKNNFVSRIGRLENVMFIDVNLFLYRFMKTAIVPGKNYAVKKSILKKIGCFRDVLTEDINVSFRLYKAGYKIKFLPAKCYEQIPDRFSWFMKQQKRWSIGGANEIKDAMRKIKNPLLSFILIPILALLAMTSAMFVLSLVAFFLLQNNILLLITIPCIIASMLSITKYLDAGDIFYLPATLPVLGAMQVLVNLYAGFEALASRKFSWEKTPKEKL